MRTNGLKRFQAGYEEEFHRNNYDLLAEAAQGRAGITAPEVVYRKGRLNTWECRVVPLLVTRADSTSNNRFVLRQAQETFEVLLPSLKEPLSALPQLLDYRVFVSLRLILLGEQPRCS